VTDSLPEGLTYDAAASDPRCSLIDEATRTIRCVEPGPLGPGERVTFTIVAQVSETLGDGSVLVNDESASARQLDPIPAESAAVTSVVVRHVSLDITKVPSTHVVHAGEHYHYTITVTNHGPSAAADVVISDHVVRGTLGGGVRAEVKGEGLDCPVTGVEFECRIPELLPGDVVTLTVPVVAPRCTRNGVIVNTATAVSADRGLARATAVVLTPRCPRPIVRPPRPVPPRPVRPRPVAPRPTRPRGVPVTG
jgi:large repetitive protein